MSTRAKSAKMRQWRFWLASPGCCARCVRETPCDTAWLAASASRLDVAKTFAVGELSEGQAKKLIPARKILDVAIALIAIDAKLKLVGWQIIQELRKNGSAKIHRLPPQKAGKQ